MTRLIAETIIVCIIERLILRIFIKLQTAMFSDWKLKDRKIIETNDNFQNKLSSRNTYIIFPRRRKNKWWVKMFDVRRIKSFPEQKLDIRSIFPLLIYSISSTTIFPSEVSESSRKSYEYFENVCWNVKKKKKKLRRLLRNHFDSCNSINRIDVSTPRFVLNL